MNGNKTWIGNNINTRLKFTLSIRLDEKIVNLFWKNSLAKAYSWRDPMILLSICIAP